MRRLVALFALALLSSCAEDPGLRGATPAQSIAAPTALVTPAEAAKTQAQVAPLVDHHQHLLSPAGAELMSTPRLPEIDLPEALDRLLREREKRWVDKAALAQLYVNDAFVFSGPDAGWLRGPQAAAEYLSQRFDGPYFLSPVASRIDGSAGHIAGYMVEGNGTSTETFGFFHIDLSKGRDGAWRIVSETHTFPGPMVKKPVTAKDLVAMLDAAGIRRAVVLSDAYYFDSKRPNPVPDEQGKVRAENDWTAREVAQFPDRLVAFCSFNALKAYALAELDRCASSKQFKGLKLHFNGSQLEFKNPEHVAKVRRVMEAANKHRLPVIIHVRGSGAYGREEAEIFLRQIVAAAPDVPVTVAHLWGGESYSASALAVYADAVSAGDPATRNLYFDVAEAWIGRGSREEREEIVSRIRQIGLQRVVYGSDGGRGEPREAWAAFGKELPLTEEERRAIANNVAPYMRDP